MINPKTKNIVDVADGCIDTMLNRGWTILEPVKSTKIPKLIAPEAKENVKS